MGKYLKSGQYIVAEGTNNLKNIIYPILDYNCTCPMCMNVNVYPYGGWYHPTMIRLNNILFFNSQKVNILFYCPDCKAQWYTQTFKVSDEATEENIREIIKQYKPREEKKQVKVIIKDY